MGEGVGGLGFGCCWGEQGVDQGGYDVGYVDYWIDYLLQLEFVGYGLDYVGEGVGVEGGGLLFIVEVVGDGFVEVCIVVEEVWVGGMCWVCCIDCEL